MSHIPPLLARAVLVAAVAVATAWAWLALTRAQVLSPGAVLVCTTVFTAVVWGVKTAVRQVRAGRPRRAPVRSAKPKGAVR